MVNRTFIAAAAVYLFANAGLAENIELGPRPGYLVDLLDEGSLKDKLSACLEEEAHRTLFSIGHRGAPLMFPEHTAEGYIAAARMGAGVVECDVTFTKDKELVCRHSQSDLHTTTDILATDLASNCTQGFMPANGDSKADAECRTSDITLEQFRSLSAKMDAANPSATTVEDYMNGTANWRTDLYVGGSGTLMTHTESIELFKSLGVKFTPELKSPKVDMPFDGFTQADYAQKLIDEYKAAGVPASDVWPQSFKLEDILYWIENEPEFGKQAVYLVEGNNTENWDPMEPKTWAHQPSELKSLGVNYLAPAIWMLLTLEDGNLAPSTYAIKAKEAGLKLIAWSLERSGPLNSGGGWYFSSIADATRNDSMYLEVLDFLTVEVGIDAMFSDWPATTSFYASCMKLK
ncbi:glycerophosphodiester phosphodiesterase family protein [Celeribacter halophilus]|jgi:glycerophosphoryl diester phosphodiesterase|uniref:glycerophosphodiester phosphodiesterase family protein n=1 Tax=Celeribacter halophilus TaxID=576117 RepID=UPI002FD327FF